MEPPRSCPLHLGPHLQTLPLGHRRKHFGQVTCVLVSSFFCTCKNFFKLFCVLLDPIPDLRHTNGDAAQITPPGPI